MSIFGSARPFAHPRVGIMALPKVNRLLIARSGNRFIAGRDFQVNTLYASAGLSAFAALPPVQAFMNGQSGYRGPFYRLFGYAEIGAAGVTLKRPGVRMEARAALATQGVYQRLIAKPAAIKAEGRVQQRQPTRYDYVKPTEAWVGQALVATVTRAAYRGPSAAQAIEGWAIVQPVTKHRYAGPGVSLQGRALIATIITQMKVVAAPQPLTTSAYLVLKAPPINTPMTVEKFRGEASVLVQGITRVMRSTVSIIGEGRVAPVTAVLEGFGVDIRAWADLPPAGANITLTFGGVINIIGTARADALSEGGIKLIGMPELIQGTAAVVGSPTAKGVSNAAISCAALCVGYPRTRIVATPQAIQATASVSITGVKNVPVYRATPLPMQGTADLAAKLDEPPPFASDAVVYLVADPAYVTKDGAGAVTEWKNKLALQQKLTRVDGSGAVSGSVLFSDTSFLGSAGVTFDSRASMALNVTLPDAMTVVVLGKFGPTFMVVAQTGNGSAYQYSFQTQVVNGSLIETLSGASGPALFNNSQPTIDGRGATIWYSVNSSNRMIGFDGVVSASDTVAYDPTNTRFSVGGLSGNGPKGAIHQVLVFGRSLSLEEIQQVESFMWRTLDNMTDRSTASIKASGLLVTTTDVRVVTPGGFSSGKVLNGQYVTLSEANRRARITGGYGIIRSVKFNTPGAKWYAEFDVIETTGVGSPTFNIGWYSSDNDNSTAGQFAINRSGTNLWACSGGSVTYAGAQIAPAAGQVIGLAIDATTDPYTWKVFINGALYASGVGVAKGTDTLLGVLFTNSSNALTAEARFRREVLYRPVGYQHWDNENTDITP